MIVVAEVFFHCLMLPTKDISKCFGRVVIGVYSLMKFSFHFNDPSSNGLLKVSK